MLGGKVDAIVFTGGTLFFPFSPLLLSFLFDSCSLEVVGSNPIGPQFFFLLNNFFVSF